MTIFSTSKSEIEITDFKLPLLSIQPPVENYIAYEFVPTYLFDDADGDGGIEMPEATLVQRYLTDIPVY